MRSDDDPGFDPITVPDTALVIEGGGMRGSLTSAVIIGLLENDLRLGLASGISAGASMATGYITQQPDRLRYSFLDVVTDPQFGGWQSLARGKGYFHADHIYDPATLPGAFAWDRFKANPAKWRIGAVRASDGEEVWWGQEDARDIADANMRIRASSTLPLMMPPPVIDGETYFDGALGSTGGIPLTVAEEEGYEKFLIVLTRPLDYVKKPVRFTRVLKRGLQEYPAIIERTLTRHERYNQMRERVLDLQKAGKAYVFYPEEMPVSNSERNLAKLTAAHELGRQQFERELPAIREFLEV